MTHRNESPLVVLANRGPYARRNVHGTSQWSRTIGGLVSALDPVLRTRGGVWIASADEGRTDDVPERTVTGYEIANVPVSADENEGYYLRVANGVLWPLWHSMPTRMQTLHAPWETYRAVNERFAAEAARHATRGSTIWVQDFQLALVPAQLREHRPGARIGWFNHIPFPAPEIFSVLPWRDEVLAGILGADLVGFQTARDAHNFLATVAERTHHRVDRARSVVQVGRRTVRVGTFPIGIDVDAVQTLAADPEVHALSDRLRNEFGTARVLVSVDRLDYTKGMPERLEAFATLLERHPKLEQRVVLVQVAVPSRIEVPEYANLKASIDRRVGEINGKWARPGWIPVHYQNRGLDLLDLVALYNVADVAVVTPLRDGMNLVAHEYPAARLDEKGVLLLSEFAGAATVLGGAVPVNPYDHVAVADAIAQALDMPVAEQQERMRRLRSAVRRHRVQHWARQFLGVLEGTSQMHSRAA